MINAYSPIILDKIVQKINNSTLNLASMPQSIIQINLMLANDDISIPEVAKLIQSEISLAVRIIRIANSPVIRRQTEIVSISDAINLLGLTLIKNLAIVVSLSDKFDTSNITHTELMHDLTTESVYKSIYGYMLTKYFTPKISPDLALISGLISKIGHIITLRFMNENSVYSTFSIEETRQVIMDIGDDITKEVLTNWKFPKSCNMSTQDKTGCDLENPNDLRDIFAIIEKYIAYKLDDTLEALPIFDRIEYTLLMHQDELESLRQIIPSSEK